jgi:hypothetical protein
MKRACGPHEREKGLLVIVLKENDKTTIRKFKN